MEEGKRVVQIIIDKLNKDRYGSTIRYNLASNLSPNILVGKDFAGNRVFYTKLVVALNLNGVNIATTAGAREWNVRKNLNALYSADARDRRFELFKKTRLGLIKESMDENIEEPIEGVEEEIDSLDRDISINPRTGNSRSISTGNVIIKKITKILTTTHRADQTKTIFNFF